MGLPAVLQAYKDQQRFVLLDDGSLGILPEQWLSANGLALQLGREAPQEATEGGGKETLRFTTDTAFCVLSRICWSRRASATAPWTVGPRPNGTRNAWPGFRSPTDHQCSPSV
jgi:hypothetical protein